MRLAMSILVRDEVDIIEHNIRHHAALGVSRFIVTDNGSVDGTREILEELTKEFDLDIIDEPQKTIDQDLWVTRMAQQLQQENSADWVINNDADELWLPSQGSLVSALKMALSSSEHEPNEIGTVQCVRHNMLPSLEDVNREGYTYAQNRFQVMQDWTDAANALSLSEQSGQLAALYDNGKHIMIRTLPGKVIARLEGLKSVDMGNHGAQHELKKIKTDIIEIAHYPVRGFKQFQKKVTNYGSSLVNNTRFTDTTCRHLRYWFDRHLAGELELEYELIVLPEATLWPLVEQGILRHLPEASCDGFACSF
ncbi:MAG: glycosyltransferase family 2 protein [Granulosicoccus sp.]|nr:glycosyltransferase family 2 protein [Granulosicoccus sp.]